MKLMTGKKRIIIIILIGILLGSAIRIYIVNTGVERQKKEYFKVNETVEFADDFSNNSDYIIDGYTVKVIDSWIFTATEFYKKYNLITEDETLSEDTQVKYYYVVKALFTNESNQSVGEKGIDLSNILLVGTDYNINIGSMVYGLINPKMPEGLGFSLREGTSAEVLLPYPVIPENIAANKKAAYEKLNKRTPCLQITSYPTKKLIETK